MRRHVAVDRQELTWQKSSRCQSSDCVEIAQTSDGVLVRNSADSRTVIRYSRAEWQAFVRGVQAGEFDLAGPPAEFC